MASRGLAWAAKKDYAKAFADYDKAISLNPSWASLYYLRGVAWYEYGSEGELRDRNRLARALADFTKTIELDPNVVDARINRGSINKMLGRLEETLADYDKVLVLAPYDERAKRVRANILRGIQAQETNGTEPTVRGDGKPAPQP